MVLRTSIVRVSMASVLIVAGAWSTAAHADPAARCPATAPNSPTSAGRKGAIVPYVSADGRYVSFESWDNNLVPNDNNKSIILKGERSKPHKRVSFVPNEYSGAN